MLEYLDQFLLVPENTGLLRVVVDQIRTDPDKPAAQAVVNANRGNSALFIPDRTVQRRFEVYFDLLYGVLRHVILHKSSAVRGHDVQISENTMSVIIAHVFTEVLNDDLSTIELLEGIKPRG